MAEGMEGIFFIHNAILKETREFEAQVRELNWEDDAEVENILERYKFFQSVLQLHENGEEEDMFPLLEDKAPHVVGSYLFDHQRHSRLDGEILELLTSIQNARSGSDRRGSAARLSRQALALDVLMEVHVSKENEVLLPVFDRYFSAEEQVALEQQFMGHVPPEVMGQMIPWMFRHQSIDDKEKMLRFGMKMLPPEALQGIVPVLSQAVPPSEWQEMERRIPELSSLTS